MEASKHILVKDYLAAAIEASGLKQNEIASKVGYSAPNIITMMKQGKTKLPPNKVPAFAEALGVDKLHFLKLVMQEYQPETWAVIEECAGEHLVTADEITLLQIIRDQADGRSLRIHNDNDRAELRAVIEKIASK